MTSQDAADASSMSPEVLPTSTVFGAAIQTVSSGPVEAKATVGHCTSNVCKPQGCASCVELTVTLQAGRMVDGVRYFSNAGGPQGDVPIRQVAPGDFAWSMMDPVTITDTGANVVITTTFHNRSHDRDRVARIDVDYH